MLNVSSCNVDKWSSNCTKTAFDKSNTWNKFEHFIIINSSACGYSS